MKIKFNKKDAIILNLLIMFLILIATVSITISSRFPISQIDTNQDYYVGHSTDRKFYVNYKSKTEDKVKIRYKSMLTYQSADIEIPVDWDFNEPLFTLSTNDNIISEAFLTADKIPIIPDVSNAISLNYGETTDILFEMKINDNAKEFQDKIRFEIKIVVEELIENKWNPVYQVILMERGPYWSLDKGPIETIMPE